MYLLVSLGYVYGLFKNCARGVENGFLDIIINLGGFLLRFHLGVVSFYNELRIVVIEVLIGIYLGYYAFRYRLIVQYHDI
jgi:hypothetical protein